MTTKSVAYFARGPGWPIKFHALDALGGRMPDLQAPALCGAVPKFGWAEFSQTITGGMGGIRFCDDCFPPAAQEAANG